MRKVGIFGGTFDPIHHGHLRLALELKQQLQLDEMRLMPSHRPPHRAAPGVTSAMRVAMVRLAVAQCPALEIDERELRRTTPSFTVDSLLELRQELGTDVSLILAVGMDAFAQLNTWHRWRELLDYAHLAVVARPGYSLPLTGDVADLVRAKQVDAEVLDAQAHGGILLSELSLLPISSSAIRAQVKRSESPQFLLPDAVWAYMVEHRLYQDIE
jgi:nicotinate-nucleotide adenylyltransferase